MPQIHLFRDRVAVSLPRMRKTVYLTPSDALDLADSLYRDPFVSPSCKASLSLAARDLEAASAALTAYRATLEAALLDADDALRNVLTTSSATRVHRFESDHFSKVVGAARIGNHHQAASRLETAIAKARADRDAFRAIVMPREAKR